MGRQEFAEFLDRNVLALANRFRRSEDASVEIENALDSFYHRLIASLPSLTYEKVENLGTDKIDLGVNLSYVFVPFIILLIIILSGG